MEDPKAMVLIETASCVEVFDREADRERAKFHFFSLLSSQCSMSRPRSSGREGDHFVTLKQHVLVTTEPVIECYGCLVTLRPLAGGLSAVFSVCLAATSQPAGGQGLEMLGRSFVEAVRSGSAQRRLELLHPAMGSCFSQQTEEYFSWIFSRQMKYVIPEVKFTVSSQPLAETWQPGRLDYPARPTHQVQIEFEGRPGSSTPVVLLAAAVAGRWYEVLPCPSRQALALERQAAAERTAQEERAQRAVAELSAGQRSEVVTLLKAGRRVEAIQRLAAMGHELAEARRMVDLVEARAGLYQAPLFTAAVKGTSPGTNDPPGKSVVDIVIREVERRPRVSVLNIEIRSPGSSVGSSFFLLCSVRRLAELRGSYRYVVKIEKFGRQTQMLVGFLETREEGLETLGPEFGALRSPGDVIDLEEFAPICDRMR
jgi:hypothetical protein